MVLLCLCFVSLVFDEFYYFAYSDIQMPSARTKVRVIDPITRT